MKMLFFNTLLITLCNSLLPPAYTVCLHADCELKAITPDKLPVDTFIARYISDLRTEPFIKLAGEKVFSNEVITGIYSRNSFAPIWQEMNTRAELEAILYNAYYQGLNPDDYHYEVISNYNSLAKVYPNRKLNDDAMADILMTNAILTYAHHLSHGKINQHDLSINWDYSKQPTKTNSTFDLIRSLHAKTLTRSIDSLQSKRPIYKNLRQHFSQMDSMHKSGGRIPLIEYPGRSLHNGDSLPAVSILKERLKADNYPIKTIDNVFDEELEAALMEFQALNGLPEDGIAGRKTYNSLNISLQDRLDIIRVNLERVRWVDHAYPEEFVLVNIASYHLRVIKHEQVTFECRAIVGKEHNQTPVFTSQIQSVTFNPNWHVPYSIASKEILPHLKTDKHYLQNRNMVLMAGNTEIDPLTVDFSYFSESSFPYSIIQKPGPSNALGRIKFILPNKYSVYLHDTPSKSLFNRIDRAFSHGCIRLEKPLELAELLLSDKGFDKEALQKILKSDEPKTIALSKGMPIMIIYMTCAINLQNGNTIFYNDIYGLDKNIMKLLRQTR
jgi:murein L,D-transpeptidase YcbB/YkuD